jgi:hypothetical protein
MSLPTLRSLLTTAALVLALLGASTTVSAQLGTGPTPGVGPGVVKNTRGKPKRGKPGTQVAAPCAWISTTATPEPRIEGPSVVYAGEMYVFGGFKNPGLEITGSVDAFDPDKGTWRHVTTMPTPVTHGAVALDDDQVWILGGFEGDHPGPVINEVWIYDIGDDTWTAGPPLPEPRGSLGAAIAHDWLHVFGGVSTNKEIDRDEHWSLRLSSPSPMWFSGPPMPEARNHFTAATVDNLIYVIGGQNGHDVNPVDRDDVHVYDRVTTEWTEVASLPFPRSHVEPGTWVRDGKIWIAGGRGNTIGQDTLSHVTSYDPLSDSWSEQLPLPAPRIAPFAKVVDGTLVVGGGGSAPTWPVNEVWMRDASLPLSATQRINSGGSAMLASPSFEPLASQPVTAWFCGDVFSTEGKVFSPATWFDIDGTTDDALYLTERTGPDTDTDELRYEIPVKPGKYLLRLHFAEIYWGAPGGGPGGSGKRVFDVFVENTLVLDDFDIYAEVGAATALIESLVVEVTDDDLDLRLDSSQDRPKISAIELIPLGL